jgi:hypothetical protein
MAKPDIKQLFLEKGEKFLLFGAIGAAALLLVWGVMAMTGAVDPVASAKSMTDKASALDRKRADTTSTDAAKKVPDLPLAFNAAVAENFRPEHPEYFEPTMWPDTRRDNPRALMPIDSQIDYVQGAVKKFGREFRDEDFDKETGELKDFRMLVITKATDNKASVQDLKDWWKTQRTGKKAKPRPQGQGGPGGMGGGPGGRGGMGGQGPGMGGQGPGMGGPGMGGGLGGLGGLGGGMGGQGPGMGGGPGGRGGGMGGMGGMMGGMFGGEGGYTAGRTSEDVVEWMRFSEAREKGTLVPAYLVYPTRMAVVQLSFPLKEQLEEIRKALRLRTLSQAVVESSPAVTFMKDSEGQPVPLSGQMGAAPGMGGPMMGGPGGMGGNTGSQDGGNPRGMMAGAGGGMGGMQGGMGGMQGAMGGAGGGTSTQNSVASPVFAGFVVQRRKVLPDGTATQWENFDHAGRWNDEFGLYDAPIKPEEGYLPYFTRPDQDMVAPMPVLSPNWTSIPQEATLEKTHYPEFIRMPSIIADYRRLVEEAKKQIPKDQALGKYSKNPGGYGGVTNQAATPGLPGMSGGEGEGGFSGFGPGMGMGGMVGQPGPTGGRPGMGGPGMGGPGMGGPGEGTTTAAANKLPVDHMLIRFLDTDLEPGLSYQYQVAVKIRNPNYNKQDKVANKARALEDVITSKYFQVKQTLTVPNESFLYAHSVKAYDTAVTQQLEQYRGPNRDQQTAQELIRRLAEIRDVNDGRKAVVQMQRWVEQTMFGEAKEPIGAWVQAEVPVAVGEFIGKKTLVELPLWRAALGRHTLTPPKENAKPLIAQWPTKQVQPLGRPVDFRTPHVLLDYEGGKTFAKVGNNTVQDEAATDLLILRDDGKVQVRKETDDTEQKDRVEREKGWKEWTDLVKKNSPQGNPSGGPGGLFDPGRGGGNNGTTDGGNR